MAKPIEQSVRSGRDVLTRTSGADLTPSGHSWELLPLWEGSQAVTRQVFFGLAILHPLGGGSVKGRPGRSGVVVEVDSSFLISIILPKLPKQKITFDQRIAAFSLLCKRWIKSILRKLCCFTDPWPTVLKF